MRDAVWERHQEALSRVGVSTDCPFDLHALVPVPFGILRLGPDHPRALAWLWANWGTTWSLRHVEEMPLTRADQAALPPGEGAFRCSFWATDWTPWPAISIARGRWLALRVDVRPEYWIRTGDAGDAATAKVVLNDHCLEPDKAMRDHNARDR